jgi:carbamoylphosphate synthase large subunit
MSTLLFLGGSYSQIPPLKYAKAEGHRVVLCDYLKDNPGKEFADAYYSASTTSINEVLTVAYAEHVDGIVAYASDPAAYTAAFVASQKSLPCNPPMSVYVLTHKDSYRNCLKTRRFNTPARSNLLFPMVVKPVDSSGSKGVRIVHSYDEAVEARRAALKFSRCSRTITEGFITRKGYQVAGDGVVVDGKLVFRCFGNEHFDPGGVVPVGESFPSVLPEETQQRIHDEVQRLLDVLEMRNGALNFDIILDKDDRIFLMEVGPRNGGNLIPEATKYATGVDMIHYTINAALGIDCSALKMAPVKGYWASYIIHSLEDGVFDSLEISPEVEVVEQHLYAKEGDPVKKFNGSHCSLGMMILRFDSLPDMLWKMDRMSDYIKAVLK